MDGLKRDSLKIKNSIFFVGILFLLNFNLTKTTGNFKAWIKENLKKEKIKNKFKEAGNKFKAAIKSTGAKLKPAGNEIINEGKRLIPNKANLGWSLGAKNYATENLAKIKETAKEKNLLAEFLKEENKQKLVQEDMKKAKKKKELGNFKKKKAALKKAAKEKADKAKDDLTKEGKVAKDKEGADKKAEKMMKEKLNQIDKNLKKFNEEINKLDIKDNEGFLNKVLEFNDKLKTAITESNKNENVIVILEDSSEGGEKSEQNVESEIEKIKSKLETELESMDESFKKTCVELESKETYTKLELFKKHYFTFIFKSILAAIQISAKTAVYISGILAKVAINLGLTGAAIGLFGGAIGLAIATSPLWIPIALIYKNKNKKVVESDDISNKIEYKGEDLKNS